MYEGPGIYQHYKGGYYRAIGLAKHESTDAMLVLYFSYSLEHESDRWMKGVDFIARPLNEVDGDDAWNTKVHDLDRFVKIDPFAKHTPDLQAIAHAHQPPRMAHLKHVGDGVSAQAVACYCEIGRNH